MQSQEQYNNTTLQTSYTLELDLDPFPTDGAHFLPNDQYEFEFPPTWYTHTHP